jgi:hypothetical protein
MLPHVVLPDFLMILLTGILLVGGTAITLLVLAAARARRDADARARRDDSIATRKAGDRAA